MPLGFIFWLLWILWVFFGGGSALAAARSETPNYWVGGGWFAVAALFFVIGWKVFGFVVQGQ